MPSLVARLPGFEIDFTFAWSGDMDVVGALNDALVVPGVAGDVQAATIRVDLLAEPDAEPVSGLLTDSGSVEIAGTCGRVIVTQNANFVRIVADAKTPSGGLSQLLRYAVGRVLAHRGHLVLHAAVLVIKGQAVLIAGPTGSGKTTLCLAALRAGASVVTDDLVLVRVGASGDAQLRAFRRDLWLRKAGLDLVDGAQGSADEPDFYDEQGDPRWLMRRTDDDPRLPVSWQGSPRVVLLDAGGFPADTMVTTASPSHGVAVLAAASSPLFLSRAFATESARGFATLGRLTGSAEVFSMTPGRDLLAAPAQVLDRVMTAVHH